MWRWAGGAGGCLEDRVNHQWIVSVRSFRLILQKETRNGNLWCGASDGGRGKIDLAQHQQNQNRNDQTKWSESTARFRLYCSEIFSIIIRFDHQSIRSMYICFCMNTLVVLSCLVWSGRVWRGLLWFDYGLLLLGRARRLTTFGFASYIIYMWILKIFYYHQRFDWIHLYIQKMTMQS